METVYKNRDNEFKVILKEDGVAVSVTALTKVAVYFAPAGKTGAYYDSENNATAFTFPTGNTGEIIFQLGTISEIPTGRDRKAELIIYDAERPNGLVWDTLDINVIEVE